MSRVEENYEVLDIINKSVEAGTYDTLQSIALTLCDISRSLAIIANEVEEENNERINKSDRKQV